MKIKAPRTIWPSFAAWLFVLLQGAWLIYRNEGVERPCGCVVAVSALCCIGSLLVYRFRQKP
jgi:hypothetical protein